MKPELKARLRAELEQRSHELTEPDYEYGYGGEVFDTQSADIDAILEVVESVLDAEGAT